MTASESYDTFLNSRTGAMTPRTSRHDHEDRVTHKINPTGEDLLST